MKFSIFLEISCDESIQELRGNFANLNEFFFNSLLINLTLCENKCGQYRKYHYIYKIESVSNFIG